VASNWLATVGADYGVGHGGHLAKVRLLESAPAAMSDSDLEVFVASHVAGGTLPAPTTDIVYALYFPETTSLTLGSEQGCLDFSGYHSEAEVNGQAVSFAAIGRCATYWPGLDVTQNVERTASHELIEAATNPLPRSAPAYDVPSSTGLSPALALREAVGEGEVGDACTGSQVELEAGFVAQRIWSNSAAAAGADPCLPAAAAPYFSVTSTQAWFAIQPGQAVEIPLTGWSAAPVDDWLVRSYLKSSRSGFTVHTTSATTLSLADGSFASTNNGRPLSVKVTAPPTAVSGDLAGIEVRSQTLSAHSGADATREATYHYLPVGVYVP
jgi:hypothetical protein